MSPVSSQKKTPTNILACGDWRSGWDSNPRARENYLISSFMKCVSGSVSFVLVSVSFVLGTKPHKHCIFRTETPKKPVVSGKCE